MSQTEVEMCQMDGNEEGAVLRSQARWWDAFVVLILFCFSQIVGGFVCGFVAPLIGMELPNEIMRESVDPEVVEWMRFLQSRMVAVSYFVAMIVCLAMLFVYGRWRGWRVSIRFKYPGWAMPFRLLCGYLLMWCVSLVLEPLAEMLPGDQSTIGGGGWLLVSAVLLAPLFEEIVFRGYVVGLLKSACGGMVAWLLSSLLFGVVHGSASVALTATASGLVLGFYYMRYRSLVLVILLHAMNNLTACFLLTMDLESVTLHDVLGEGVLYWSVYGLCAAVVLLSVVRMIVVVSRIKRENIS